MKIVKSILTDVDFLFWLFLLVYTPFLVFIIVNIENHTFPFDTIASILAFLKDLALIIIPFITISSETKRLKQSLKHTEHMKIIDEYDVKKRELLEKFISDGLDCISNKTGETQNEFLKTFFTLKLYFEGANDEFYKKIKELIDNHSEIEENKIAFFKALSVLEKEIKKH